ncbi:hypothetical protein Tco_1065079 [Tanacetum coccineum]
MLKKGLYKSWKSRILLYIECKENGEMLLDSINNGPFQFNEITVPSTETIVEEKRMQELKDLTSEEKIRKKTSSNPRTQATIQDGRVIVQNVQGRQSQGYEQKDFLADGLEDLDSDDDDLQLHTTSIFKEDHIDAFDSDCDEVLIASEYSWQGFLLQTEYSEHLVFNNDSYDEPTSDSNIISYADYKITIKNDAAQSVPPPEQDNAMILSRIEQM